MSTYNRTVSQYNQSTAIGSTDDNRRNAVIEAIIDFSATGNANLAADVFNAINVPAGFAILGTGVEVLKADTAGNSGTIQLKLGATAQGSAVAPSATGYLATVGTFTPVVPAQAQAFLNVVIGTGAINAVVRVYAILQECRLKKGTGVATGTGTNPAGQTTTTYRAQTSTETANAVVA